MDWHGSARAGWGLGAVAALLLGCAAAFAVVGLPVAAVAIAVVTAVAVATLVGHEVTIDDRAVLVRSRIGWTTTIPREEIEAATVTEVKLSGRFESGRSLHGIPFQGWSGRVIRSGEELKLTLTDHRSYTVSLDNTVGAVAAFGAQSRNWSSES